VPLFFGLAIVTGSTLSGDPASAKGLYLRPQSGFSRCNANC
jgi:hypothetical protein